MGWFWRIYERHPKATVRATACVVTYAIVFALAMGAAQWHDRVDAAPQSQTAPYPTALQCPYHDRHAYHGVWDYQLGCWQNHVHGDDPHSVDDIFGTHYYHLADGEIGYPWQTAGENHVGHKHEGYKWVVRRDIPCPTDPFKDCVRAMRAQVHADLTNVVSVYHSFYVEAQVCPRLAPDDCGIVRFGGWQDTGPLLIDKQVIVAGNQALGEKRHFDQTDNRTRAVWYQASPSRLGRVNFMTADMWGYYPITSTLPIDLDDMVWFGDEANNGSRFKPYSAQFDIPFRFRTTLDPDNDGYADYVGWVDRYGEIVTNCDVAPYWDCVPVSWEHVKIPAGSYFAEFGTGADLREYDVLFNGEPSGWIEYPN